MYELDGGQEKKRLEKKSQSFFLFAVTRDPEKLGLTIREAQMGDGHKK